MGFGAAERGQLRTATALLGLLTCGALASCASGVGRKPDVALARTAAEPKGFGQALTELGPVFTDQTGLSLYVRTRSDPCTDARDPPPPPDANARLKAYYANFVGPSCLDQWPAVAATADDRPVGDWTIVTHKDGRRQWAYRGQLVHRSYKDRLPGDLNANPERKGEGWAPALVPLNLPPGVLSRYRPGIGVIATTLQSMTLYTMNPAEAPASSGQLHKVSVDCCKVSVDNLWRPLPAGGTAVASKPWSVLSQNDGSRVWGYHGQPVFAYTDDAAAGEVNGLSRGAEPIVLYPLPKAPLGITVERTPLGPAYANAEGMTLYVFTCDAIRPGGDDRLTCDNWNDNLRYREQYCPTPDRCGELWRPVYAPDTARPSGGLWSVVTLPDPRYPFRWVPSGGAADTRPGAVKIWSYRGRPVYSSTFDLHPGEVWGETVRDVFVVVFAGIGVGG